MKVLVIKEYMDELGFFSCFDYDKVDLYYILNTYKTKANGIHTIFSFNADCCILHQNSKHYKNHESYNNSKIKNFINNNTISFKNVNDIDFNKYDIIWCRDDILYNIKFLKKKFPNVLFIYENVEHAYPCFNYDYDLILDHTDFSYKVPERLNCKVSFPYIINKDFLRESFDCKKTIDIMFDSRDIKKYQELYKLDNIVIKNKMRDYFIINNLQLYIQVTRPEALNANDETSTENYFKNLSSCKYFVLTFERLGQSLVEAASFKCILIGNDKCINSKFIVHKTCLFSNFATPQQIKEKILFLESNIELQNEILEYQDKMLKTYFYEYQKDVINKALEMKRKNKEQ